MSRFTGSACHQCRRDSFREQDNKREISKLMLKGDRCFTDKCAIERRAYPPGQHGQNRSKMSDYAVRLREKQKAKRIYGIQEKQFRRIFAEAGRRTGNTGDTLMQMLETRMDNLVFRLGFANTRREARQMVSHGHFAIDGRKVTIPSIVVKPGSKITLRERSRSSKKFQENLEVAKKRSMPSWLELNAAEFSGVLLGQPVREELQLPLREQLIIELYSR
ncbi:MAG: 30S ribosomal protein S4 [Myxococcota bacterium]|nr:30S ribosomal protein S4 [Myxococcota bacterium]